MTEETGGGAARGAASGGRRPRPPVPATLDRRELLLAAGALALGAEPAATRLKLDPVPARPAVAGGAGPRALRELARRTRGPLLRPSSSGFAAAARVYNARFDGVRPDAVFQPLDTRDVEAAVRWANRYDVRLTPRSGGHSYAGYSTAGEGVVVDLRRLRGIGLAGRRATIGAGARLIDVYETLARRGATIPAGSCPTVGLGGLALGGGYGLASRALGLTADRVRALTVVTADGRVRTVDARRDEDLYWALRGGGGGNFGIVTRFELQAHPVGNASYFTASFPWAAADRALAAWQAWAPETDPALTSVLTLGASRTVSASGQCLGSERRLASLLGPLRAAGATIATGTSSYAALQLRWANGRTSPRSTFSAKSHYVRRSLPAGVRARLLAALAAGGDVPGLETGVLIFDAYGGAINRPARSAIAFAHRDERFSIQYLAYHSDGGGASRAWLRKLHRAVAPHASGAYQNYLDPELEGWRRAYYGANLARLREVAARYDPDGRFRCPRGVRA